ncbi:protein ALP1-like [Magnolia sinica]|uniref:protein ALP1-like n=1 Tax=Magnolia sinica TaxID=86752 RepID=UPI00265A5775|nr:protein ALP1-like [Magnolia sinica]
MDIRNGNPTISAGWEGSVLDSRILADALNQQYKLIVPAGKYYLVDAGFANVPGFLAPFRGVRYHLKEFRQGCQPRTKEELFNLRHSLLRNAIERALGVLKARFSILKIASGYPLNTQVNIVAACCILHNHIINEKRDQELDFENNNDIGNGEDESEMHEDEGNESSEDENECDF